MNITSCDCAHNSSGAFRDSTLDVEEAAAVWTMVDVVTARRENVLACLLWASAGWGCLVVGVFSWSVVGRPPPRRVAWARSA